MKFRITHTTQFNYSQSVSYCHSEARLQPRNFPGQHCLYSDIQSIPECNNYQERLDYFGNRIAYFALQQPHKRLDVTAISEVEVQSKVYQANINEYSWEEILGQLQETSTSSEPCWHLDFHQAKLYSLDSELAAGSDAIHAYATKSFIPGRTIFTVAEDLTQRIFHDFSYDPSFTTIATPLATVLAHKRGVCQDFAHLAIACFRSFGLPARYISGYIETTPPPGETKLAGSDASHAWFSVFIPGFGWLDFDPTNNCMTAEQHITLAWGRDYNDVTPLKGLAVGGSDHQVAVSVDVVRAG